MRNSSSQFKRAFSLKDGEMNGVNGESPLHNFVKAKQKINSTFSDIGKYLDDCNNFLSDCNIDDENDKEIKKFSSEASLCLPVITQIKTCLCNEKLHMLNFFNTKLYTFS